MSYRWGEYEERVYLDGAVGDRSRQETILQYAKRLRLPCASMLEEWNNGTVKVRHCYRCGAPLIGLEVCCEDILKL